MEKPRDGKEGSDLKQCPICNGSGKGNGARGECVRCHGKGKVPR
jgi:RecJ-like exonuclease